MSETPDYFEDVAEGEAIDDFLVSLASGLASAQQQLSELTANNALGAGGVTYQIPRLDFELSLQIHTESSTGGNGKNKRRGRRKTRVKSVDSSSTDLKANSMLKGSFVAVPVNGGRPQPVVSLSFEETGNAFEVAIEISVFEATGQPLAGIEVELNVDKELSDEINQREGIEKVLSDETRIATGVVITDAKGLASSILLISKEETNGINIAVTADAQNASASLMYRTGNGEVGL